MAKKQPLQLRVDPMVHQRLRALADAAGSTMNALAAEALEAYLPQLASQLGDELAETAARLRAWGAEPGALERDIAAWVQAEVSQRDPTEGEPVLRPDLAASSEADREIERILAGLG